MTESAPIESLRPLEIQEITQVYGSTTALDGVSITIEAGEFITLLGPSGCGKTTLLRIIAGFIRPTRGRVLLGDQDVTRLAPHKRPFNMVFQRPTLFPHLDVYGNVAFGLRIARLDKAEIQRRVGETLELVRLGGFERRRAHELSGGQMQRVALARALVNQPSVLLLDEPLSALDLKIRLDMEVELRRVHRDTGATFVYVTHDQREALALSDRIAVFDHGHIEQLGVPEDVYRHPSSAFAARFVGDANVIPVDVLGGGADGSAVQIGEQRRPVPNAGGVKEGPGWLVLRPELVDLHPVDASVDGAIRGTVIDFAFRGTGYSYRIDVPGLAEPVKAETAAGRGRRFLTVGEPVLLDWDVEAALLLPRDV